ncbi:hypothetical protein RN607_00520 [Demequina capsici]|uniref:Uncharacterized protein n=1 Tax=Demequina capsici TaxID=3075620 RepID=A0AA96FB39_9MICO|nr:hypothetical protein [Demequina sp. PMTSA13]WNM27516.1 hypothetical protein RN607_00520 [Demequina sp. PMTSA13]
MCRPIAQNEPFDELAFAADHYEPTLTGEVPALPSAEDALADDLLARDQRQKLQQARDIVDALAAVNAAILQTLHVRCTHSTDPTRPCWGCINAHTELVEQVKRNDEFYGRALAALMSIEVRS